MKPANHTTPAQATPSLAEMSRWPHSLRQLHERLTPSFARSEPLRHALLYLQAVLSDIPRKNGWQIAEQARQPHPYGMQRLLSRAVWDHDGVRDELRSFVAHSLKPPVVLPTSAQPQALFPVLVIDESGFPKRGRHSAGVQPQYCGATGQIENCQVGVFLSYVTALGHALIDRELYLPEEWCADAPRRLAAHIPPSVSFQTKPELAQHMLERAQAAGLPIRWVVGDTVYGHSPDLRRWLEEQDDAYALAVPCTEVVCVQTQEGARLGAVGQLANVLLSKEDWQRLSQSLGTKGERLFDWAILPVVQSGVVDQRHWLVFRRCLDAPHELDYYLVFAPLGTPLSLMVQVIGARWHIEEDLQATKALGLDQYEVRSYLGWYRHLTLVLLAYAFLVSLCVPSRQLTDLPEPAAPSPDPCPPPAQPLATATGLSQPSPAAPPLIPLTPSEVRHLLSHLFWPAPTSAPLICHWSCWRRTHQYWAGYYHRRRRQKAPCA